MWDSVYVLCACCICCWQRADLCNYDSGGDINTFLALQLIDNASSTANWKELAHNALLTSSVRRLRSVVPSRSQKQSGKDVRPPRNPARYDQTSQC